MSSSRGLAEQLGRRTLNRRMIYVPQADWPSIRRGAKEEFRGSGAAWGLDDLPFPVALYSTVRNGGYEVRMAVLTACWKEPLGAISAESLEAEGHESLADFRQWWVNNRRPNFNVLQNVTVFRVRPWQDQDSDEMAHVLLDRLYPPKVFRR